MASVKLRHMDLYNMIKESLSKANVEEKKYNSYAPSPERLSFLRDLLRFCVGTWNNSEFVELTMDEYKQITNKW